MSTNNPIRITAKDGEVLMSTRNPDILQIRVEQKISAMNNGFFSKQTRSALISGDAEEMREENFREGQILPGKVLVIETLKPQYDGQEPKMNPETGEIVTQDGKPVYRNTQYTEDTNQIDTFINHRLSVEEEKEEEKVSSEAGESITH